MTNAALTGYLVAAGGFAAIMGLSQLIFRHYWPSYPTLAQYLATHPECDKPEGAVCNRCGRRPARMGVTGRGAVYRCVGCDTELFRVDRGA